MNQVNAIELRNLSKRFGKVVANDRINLSVRHGEIMAILGENGSGKTTLMNMISGIYYPDEGEIYVNGELGDHPLAQGRLPAGHRHDPSALQAGRRADGGGEHRARACPDRLG